MLCDVAINHKQVPECLRNVVAAVSPFCFSGLGADASGEWFVDIRCACLPIREPRGLQGWDGGAGRGKMCEAIHWHQQTRGLFACAS
jgi:hypothetical protein